MLDAAMPALDETASGSETTGPSEFELLGLPKPLVSGLARQGIDSPFPIQSATIPDVLAGADVLGRGQTGSGKTLAFGLPTMARLAGVRPTPGHPRAMILVPTRELALQVHDALEPLGRGLGLRMKVVVGGMSMGKQIEALRRGVDIVIATPGRLGDLIRQGECSLADVEVSVLDEADHMCDLGFFPVVTDLLAQTPSDGQRLLFSATLDGDVDKLVQRFLKNPITHSVAPATSPVDTMEHHVMQVTRDEKFDVIAEIANREGRTIIFVRTQHGVDRLCKQLARVGVKAGGLHGGKRQNQRTRILAEFREGAINVLVCTDVAARGIHVDNISLVLHVDPPQDHKSYLHRGGRTARAGEKGTVVTLVLPSERRSTDALTRRAGIHPFRLKATPGHPRVAEVTGARTPSGEAIPVWEPDVRKPLRPRRDGGPAERRGSRRPRRSFDGDRRPRRHEDGDRAFGSGDERRAQGEFDGERRPYRAFDADRRPRRDFDGEARPRREFDGEARPRREFDGERRPARDFDGDRRPRREFDGERRPVRHAEGERPFGRSSEPRTFGDDRRRDGRPRGGYRSDDRPFRQDDRGQRGGYRSEDRGGRYGSDRGRPFSAPADRERGYRADGPRDGYRPGGGRPDERANGGFRRKSTRRHER